MFSILSSVLFISFQNFIITADTGADFSRPIDNPLLSFPVQFRKTIYVDCELGENADLGYGTTYGSSPEKAVGTLKEASEMIATEQVTRVLLKKGTICPGVLDLSNAQFESISVDSYENNMNPAAEAPTIVGTKLLPSNAWKIEPELSSVGKTIYSASVSDQNIYHMNINDKIKPVANVLDICSSQTLDPMIEGYGMSGAAGLYDLVTIPSDDKIFSMPLSSGAAVFLRDATWIWKKFDIDSIQSSSKQLKLKISASAKITSPTLRNGYRIVNSLSVLDCPSEWSFDTLQKKIYYFNEVGLPAPGLGFRNVGLTVEKYGIIANFYGKTARNLYIRNVKVRYTGEAGIKINNGGNILLDNVNVENSNGFGINIYGASRVGVFNSTITNSNRTGASIVNVALAFHFEKNSITNSGKLDQQAAGIPDLMSGLNASADGWFRIKNNIIKNSGSGGLYLRASKTFTFIASNTIERSCMLINDCAGIYINGYSQNDFRGIYNADTSTETVGSPRVGIGSYDVEQKNEICKQQQQPKSLRIEYNLVQSSVGYLRGLRYEKVPKILAGGIYLDWAASNAIIYKNEIRNVRHMRGGIHLHGGRNILVKENVVDQTESGYPALSVAQLWNIEKQPIATCYNSIVANDFRKSKSNHYLIQLRRNNYLGGSLDFSSLANFWQNNFVDPEHDLPARTYEFRTFQDTNNDEVPEQNEPTLELINVN